MGISLYGLTPATTYDALIKTGDNAPIDATLKPLSDGVGTNLPMEASTTGINFTGSLLQGGIAVPTAAQVSAKQDTLVSGTNIKTINGTSVLGSGNITTPNVSGVAGAIQFSNGSAFASDATNFFWDNTNKRLGVGTNAPVTNFEVYSGIGGYISHNASSGYNGFSGFRCNVAGGTRGYMELNPNTGEFKVGADGSGYFLTLGAAGVERMRVTSTGTIVKGSGSTSATTSLLVQNSAGTEALKVRDDLLVILGGGLNMSSGSLTAVSVDCSSGVFAPSGGNGVKWGSNVFAISNTNGILKLSNGTNSDWDRLQFGGTTSSFPALKKSGTTLQSRLADDSGYAPIDASLYKVGGTNGFTGTGSYTNFTIVGGIITNAS